MKFNIDDYKGKYVMHCKTEEEAKSFCGYLNAIGRRTCTGNTWSARLWDFYKDSLTINFNDGSQSDIFYYEKNGYTILEWSDFMNNTFTKADLKTGDVIKLRDGRVGIVNRDFEMAIFKDGWFNLENTNQDLTSLCIEGNDIIAVRRPECRENCQFSAFQYKCGTLIYDRERDEVEELTLAEVCKLLGKNIKIIQ